MQLLLGFFMLFFYSFSALASDWNLAKEQDGVQLYHRHLVNGDFAVKARVMVKSDLSALLILLNDTRNSHKWIANNQKVRVLDRPQYHQAIVHSFFHAPWPVKNRDMITHSYTSQNPSSLEVKIEIKDVGQHYPHRDNYIRMHNISGLWLIKPMPGQKIEISYQGTASPAGDIPQWLAEELLLNSTFTTFQNLQRVLPTSKYQNKPLRGIKEP